MAIRIQVVEPGNEAGMMQISAWPEQTPLPRTHPISGLEGTTKVLCVCESSCRGHFAQVKSRSFKQLAGIFKSAFLNIGFQGLAISRTKNPVKGCTGNVKLDSQSFHRWRSVCAVNVIFNPFWKGYLGADRNAGHCVKYPPRSGNREKTAIRAAAQKTVQGGHKSPQVRAGGDFLSWFGF